MPLISLLRWTVAIVAVSGFMLFGLAAGSPPVLPAALIAGFVIATLWRFRSCLPARFRPGTAWHLFSVFWLTMFALAALLDFTLNMPVAMAERERVVAEFAAVVQPSLTDRLSYGVTLKPSSVLVSGTYRAAAATWRDLRDHFDRVLGEAGWSLAEESTYTSGSGYEAGGRVACYLRGQDRANLYYPGWITSYSYSFSIRWDIGRSRC